MQNEFAVLNTKKQISDKKGGSPKNDVKPKVKLLVKLHAPHRYTTDSHATLPARLERLNHEAKSQNHNWCSPSHTAARHGM